MAARGLVNGRGPRTAWEGFSFSNAAIRIYPPLNKKKLTFWASLIYISSGLLPDEFECDVTWNAEIVYMGDVR